MYFQNIDLDPKADAAIKALEDFIVRIDDVPEHNRCERAAVLFEKYVDVIPSDMLSKSAASLLIQGIALSQKELINLAMEYSPDKQVIDAYQMSKLIQMGEEYYDIASVYMSQINRSFSVDDGVHMLSLFEKHAHANPEKIAPILSFGLSLIPFESFVKGIPELFKLWEHPHSSVREVMEMYFPNLEGTMKTLSSLDVDDASKIEHMKSALLESSVRMGNMAVNTSMSMH